MNIRSDAKMVESQGQTLRIKINVQYKTIENKILTNILFG